MNRIIGQTTGPFIDSLRKDKSQIASVSPLVIFRRLLDLGERVDPHSVTKQLKNFAKSCGKLRDFQMRWIDTSFTGEVITFDVGDIPVWIKLKIIREPMGDGKACINFVVVVTDEENGKRYTRLFGSMSVERDADGNDVPTVRTISDMIDIEDIPVKRMTGEENLQPLKKEAEKPVEQKDPEKKEEPKPLKAAAPTGSVIFKKGDVIRFLDGDALCVTIQKLGPLADGEVASTTKLNLGDASLLNIVRFDIEYVTNRDVYDTDFSSDADRAANKIMDALDMWTPPAPEHAEEKAKPEAEKPKDEAKPIEEAPKTEQATEEEQPLEESTPEEEHPSEGSPSIPDVSDNEEIEEPAPSEEESVPQTPAEPEEPETQEEQPMEATTTEQAAVTPVGEAVVTTLCKDEHPANWYMTVLFGSSDPDINMVLNKLSQENDEGPSPEFKLSKTYPIERMICYSDYTFSIIRMKNGAFYRIFVAHTDLDRGANAAWLYTADEPDRWFMIGNVTDPEISRIVNRRRM